ncbi:hypothetical protein PC121_g10717 [Phytophthora cactorum]|nr:hypothetical protein PC120_g10249 [Phytophthora cactorum]KAG3066879.1 hypothetical protein PC121_g10717 [Phytophthora cactorum]KAG4053845.1 hypothetical protein PC123_g11008 [Phytophthora cactorum]
MISGKGTACGRVAVADAKKAAKNAISYAKRKGVLTDVVDAGEMYLISIATKLEHEDLIKSLRGDIRRRYGVGVPKSKRPAKGFPEMKARVAVIRAKRKAGGSFKL